MKVRIILACLSAVIVAGCATMSAPADSYLLKIRLQSPFNEDFSIETAVEIGKPFEVTRMNGKARNTVAGVLGHPLNGKFPLELTVSEWMSATDNITGTGRIDLELDKPSGGGVVSSFVYMRTITLTRKP